MYVLILISKVSEVGMVWKCFQPTAFSSNLHIGYCKPFCVYGRFMNQCSCLGKCQNMWHCFSLAPIWSSSNLAWHTVKSDQPVNPQYQHIGAQSCSTPPKIYLQPNQLRLIHGTSCRWWAVPACRGKRQLKTRKSLPVIDNDIEKMHNAHFEHYLKVMKMLVLHLLISD